MYKILTLITLVWVSSFCYSQHSIGDGGLSSCSSDIFDSGGMGGNYSSSESITETYCSSSGNCLRISFSSFDVESGFDELTIYDGADAAGTLIGTYTGTTSPGTITSTTGCFTFVWESDGSVTRAGWEATLSCVAGCTHSCGDGVQNGGETQVDCGGPTCAACPPTCSDGIQNGTETGVDCGGTCPVCPPIVIATPCATETFNITQNSAFYDDGGPGGSCTDNDAGNFSDAGCVTTTTICAPAGNFLIVDVNTLEMFNTSSNFDWMRVYDGTGTGGTVFFDNASGGAQAAATDAGGYGDCGDAAWPTPFCSTARCLTFEFNATGVVNRSGWDMDAQIGGSFCNPVLSLDILSFEVKRNENNDVDLVWKTANEINCSHFSLQRSYDGLFWEKLEKININKSSFYSYTDFGVKGSKVYYRLKQYDNDGSYIFSDVRYIELNSDEKYVVSPNPINDRFKLTGEFKDDNNIQIYNSLGQNFDLKLLSRKENSREYDVSSLSKGLYFLIVTNNFKVSKLNLVID